MNTPLAGYLKERQAFTALLQADSEKRILLIHGLSGSGKTTFIEACLNDIPEDIPYVPIQLRGSTVGVTEIFYRVGEHIGWKQMPNFVKQVAAIEGVPVVQVKRNLQLGSNNQIHVALHAEDLGEQEDRRVSLTGAWFEDLKKLPRLLLLVLDTFEQATTEVSGWVEGPLLARAVKVNQLRVLLAGQILPDMNNIEWGKYCSCCDLYGVLDAQDWLPVVNARNRYIPFSDPLLWLAGVCYALGGRPDAIMKIIESLPKELPR